MSLNIYVFCLMFSDLAVHIDGFIGSSATTIIIGATKENPVTGKKADVLMAAYLCSEAALRIVKAGNKVMSLAFFIHLFTIHF